LLLLVLFAFLLLLSSSLINIVVKRPNSSFNTPSDGLLRESILYIVYIYIYSPIYSDDGRDVVLRRLKTRHKTS
jgi:hypothetical protein